MKNEKGITLIALVVTIIVLLILASVSISALTSENGIITKAKLAEEETEKGTDKELMDLALLEYELSDKSKTLEAYLKEKEWCENVTPNIDTDTMKIVMKNGREYEIAVALPDYTQNDIDETLKYFTFDSNAKILTTDTDKVGLYLNRSFGLEVVVFPKEINGVAVTEIGCIDGEGLFSSDTTIQKVIILAEITEIRDAEFYGCTNLKSIELPDSITSIGSRAFNLCVNLESIKLPNCLTSIGMYAFEDCTGLKSIEIPDDVTSIGSYAFRNCTSLESIVIPSSVTSIEESTFSGCTNLTNVYYTGTEAEWNAITIDDGNNELTNATITCNYVK